MKSIFRHNYEDVISLDNLILAWQEFIIDKKKKQDVMLFRLNLMDNIIQLHNDLANQTYQHGGYYEFYITDPKKRHIHKASVRDRLLHHAVYRILYPFFDKTFIYDSYSCRKNKGLHKAINQFRRYHRKVSQNDSRPCWILKCDIKKFFANIDHSILFNVLKEYITDTKLLNLLKNIIDSFGVDKQKTRGLPLGNLTSQLFTNVYMNILDQFVKHKLKAKYYIRYADDFVFMADDKKQLNKIIPKIKEFLEKELKLYLHENKLFIESINSGVDFLGWVHFSKYRIPRKKTKARAINRVEEKPVNPTLQSYLGLFSHGNTHKFQKEIKSTYWLFAESLD
ncbi:MAG: reverse transcriptase/maturase family protein [bacterium]